MTFAQFFGAVWNKKPFPWQIKLAEMAMRGEWPPIGLPTAAGKTALIDIAVFALAMGAPRSARRIFFVVDRRVIVDEAAARAEFLAEKLANADPSSDLGKLADALRNLGGGSEPLLTATLRGGIPRDTWTDSPLQPTVICSTVDQVGSSLLFRAYGSNEYGWPIRAGLAACDSLIILDEAHTSRPFAETLALIDRYRSWAERPLDHCFTVVDMSATLPNDDALKESAEDLEDIVLKARWTAEKRAKLVSEKPDAQERAAEGFTALIQGLVLEARRMRDQGARVIGVVVNRVMTARKVHEMLSADNGFDAILLIGRARPFDRDEIWRKWQPWIGLDRDREPERPIFVVATQCIEVGANIDFDALVTEIASLDALEQRFGRLDRNGKRGVTRASIVAQRDPVKLRMGCPTLRLHPKLVERWNNNDLAKRFCDAGSVTEVRSILSGTPDAQTAAWVQDAVAALTKSRILKLLDHPDEDQSCWAAVIGKVAFDQGSYRASYTTEVRLALHLKGCEKWAESLARRLPEIVRKTVIRAAGLHDVGKADPRFQAWLRGGNPVRPDELLAKSRRSGPNRAALERARQVAGYPKGGRHELLSVKLIEDGGGTADYDGDLLLHLVASHHGRCRPFAPVIADDAPVQFCYEGRKTSTAHRLERAGSGVCERFWRLTRRYGWYGLAYLEAVVRLADHKESEAEENSAHVEMEAARA